MGEEISIIYVFNFLCEHYRNRSTVVITVVYDSNTHKLISDMSWGDQTLD